MSENNYQPPKVWEWKQNNGGAFANINRPVSGATHERVLPVGSSAAALLTGHAQRPEGDHHAGRAAGVRRQRRGVRRLADSHWRRRSVLQRLCRGQPELKIPALSDHSTTPTRVFESGSILLYLAEKFGFFLPKDPAGRTETLNWLFWLQGAAPFLGGGFGHFLTMRR
jgi:GST-like protein